MFVAWVFETQLHAISSGAAFENRDGCSQMEDAGAGLHLHLRRSRAHAVGAAQEMIERVDDVRRKHGGEIEPNELPLAAGVEHLREGAVSEHNAAIGRERYDAGGDGFYDG